MASANATEFESQAEHIDHAELDRLKKISASTRLEKFAADPGVQRLSQQIADLAGRDDWPADRYARIDSNGATKFLSTLNDEDYELVRQWVDVAVAESDISPGNQELWQMCLCDFTDTLEEFLLDEEIDDDESIPDAATHSVPWSDDLGHCCDLLDKAFSIVMEIIPWRDPESNKITLAIVSGWSPDVLDSVMGWAEDVVSTNEAGGSIHDNGGTLLNVPEPLRDLFDWETAEVAAIKAKPEGIKAKPEGMTIAETADEARIRIEDMIPTAFRQLRDAESIAESRKKAHDAAKKNVDAMQDQLNQLVEELTEAITGIQGGDYQLRLPLDRVSNSSSSVATALPGGDTKSGIVPVSSAISGPQEKSNPKESVAATPAIGLVAADPIAGEPVSILVADQLSARTNGKSDGVGIPQGTVDLLVDASLGTVGLLEEQMRRRGEWWAREIKGVGPGKAEKIIAALDMLRACFPLPIQDGPLEELILDEAAYQKGVAVKQLGGPRICGYPATGHQGRSWLKGYDDQARMECG